MPTSSLAALIRAEAEARGRLTFAEFMAMALYHPTGGYYTQSGRVGEGGDFYTSPAAHPAFGALLCVQLWRMWHRLGYPSRFTAVELGAGDGLLARDICSYADRLSPQFSGALVYLAVDVRRPSGPPPFSGQVQPIISDRLPLRGVTGCVIANELLDALPFPPISHKRRRSSRSLRRAAQRGRPDGGAGANRPRRCWQSGWRAWGCRCRKAFWARSASSCGPG